MKSHNVMKSHKDMKFPKETVLSEKKIVLELWRSGANKRAEKLGNKEENWENIVSEKPVKITARMGWSTVRLRGVRMQMCPSTLHHGGPLNISATKCIPWHL